MCNRSHGEARLLAFLRRNRLPLPEMNAQIGRIRVDAYWAQLGLAVELDCDQTHGTAWAVEDDAWRDAYVRARGIRLLRIEEADFAVLAAERSRLNGAAA